MADAKTEKQKVKEITDKLEEGLKELFESEKYKSYLSTMSKFHNYSFNNTLLIALQRPDASLVAGYPVSQARSPGCSLWWSYRPRLSGLLSLSLYTWSYSSV